MTKAFQVADYETVEALFDKLSLENKKKFLQEAVEMTEVTFGENSKLPRTFLDIIFYLHMMFTPRIQEDTMLLSPEKMEEWAVQKAKQTQLLGRLTLSLFEESVEEKQSLSNTVIPAQAGIQTKDVHTASLDPRLRGGDGNVLRLYYVGDLKEGWSGQMPGEHYTVWDLIPFLMQGKNTTLEEDATTQSLAIWQTEEIHAQIEDLFKQIRLWKEIRENQPPGMTPFAMPGHDDGFITLNSYGRVYIKGLDAGEIIDAVTFHLSRFVVNQTPVR